MSHFTAIKTANIVSESAFIAAVTELGFKDIKKGGEIRGWAGQKQRMDVAVTVPNCKYDFGIKKSADGKTFDLIAEDYLNKYEKPGILGKVVQFATKHTLIQQYRLKGFAARVTVDAKTQAMTVSLTR